MSADPGVVGVCWACGLPILEGDDHTVGDKVFHERCCPECRPFGPDLSGTAGARGTVLAWLGGAGLLLALLAPSIVRAVA